MENHFSPLMTHLSPRFSARVLKVRGSEPPVGSDMEKAERMSPFSSGQSHFSFCSGVP